MPNLTSSSMCLRMEAYKFFLRTEGYLPCFGSSPMNLAGQSANVPNTPPGAAERFELSLGMSYGESTDRCKACGNPIPRHKHAIIYIWGSHRELMHITCGLRHMIMSGVRILREEQ